MRIGTVDYGGQHNTAITYLLDNGTQIGDAVTATAAGTAGRGTADAALLGKVSTKEFDGLGAVVKRGVIVVPWTGAAVFGHQKIGVDGTGKAKVSATGRGCDVIGVDTTNNLAAIDLG
ncbi:hypothetical protein [Deinococcus sp. Leaf326]|uniref:hypothetical protein n=1 Tax=Deinococcus sp. Leaf326 TaxID=1736338 RepID=UPI0006FDC4AF|nr:hypothetical protein [Deinococcus sp. Leaf326]KQR33129.1 hypothetical protein ASF71_16695 [Deinococcus sp. Leaf326]